MPQTSFAPKKISISPISLLFFIGLALLCNLIISKSWINYQFLEDQRSSLQQYIKQITNTSASQLGRAIQNEDTATLESNLAQLIQQPEILKASIYRHNGQLIASNGQISTERQHHSSAVNIIYDNQDIGFLITYFSNDVTSLSEQTSQSISRILWVSTLLVFIGIFIILFYSRLKHLLRYFRKNTTQDAHQPPLAKHVLKDILQKKSNTKSLDDYYGLLIIKANWSDLNQEKNLRLLQFFKNWLRSKEMSLISLKGEFLQLGIDQEIQHNGERQLQLLEHCLKQLQVNPKILLHTQNIDLQIVENFFEVLEEGVWCDCPEQIPNSFEFVKSHNVDIESIGSVKLAKLATIKSDYKTALERQSRFLLSD